MKKQLIICMGAAVLLSSCGTASQGMYTGATFGHVVGSAIGGISGGHRGHDWGSLIGTVGGAVAGAAVGAAVENAGQRDSQSTAGQRTRRVGVNQRTGSYDANGTATYDASGFDPTHSGDDRITFGEAPSREALYIRNAQLTDADQDGVLTRGEECTVQFEIMNNSAQTVYDVSPFVEDATGNKHVAVSPNLQVERIAPHQGVRYTATILADKRLKDGEIQIRIGVMRRGQEVASQTQQFTIPTRKKKQ